MNPTTQAIPPLIAIIISWTEHLDEECEATKFYCFLPGTHCILGTLYLESPGGPWKWSTSDTFAYEKWACGEHAHPDVARAQCQDAIRAALESLPR